MLSSKTWISIALGPNWPNNPYHILPWWPFGCGRLLKAIDRGDPLKWADMLCALGLPCRIAFVCLTARPTTVLEQREILRLDHQLWPHEWDNYMTIIIWLIYVSICTYIYIYINVYYSFLKLIYPYIPFRPVQDLFSRAWIFLKLVWCICGRISIWHLQIVCV